MLVRNHYIISFIVLFALGSCGIKRQAVYDFAIKKADIPIFIEIPKNDLVFENISPLIYDVFTDHFERVGYRLVTKSSDGYSLCITIKSLDSIYKYVSPDIVLFNSVVKVDLFCQILNYNKDVIAKKSFTFTALVPKPQNPILNSDFTDFTYMCLLKKAAPKIEQYFRQFLLKSVD